MPDATDLDLVREYARGNSNLAFAELVRRHINLVYSVALRFTGKPADAEDVAQAVFVILARKAGGLRQRVVLTGWLYETTRFTALQWLRNQSRRHRHEQEALMESSLNGSDSDRASAEAAMWRQMAPMLEEAMSRLNENERTLLALRFFENRTGAETAAALGIGEWAARKRADRALDKLRRFFAGRGVNSTTALIADAITAHSVQAAPAALAGSVTALALAKGAAASVSTLTLINGALKLMAWTKAKTAVVVSACVLLAAGTATVIISDANSIHGFPPGWSVLNGSAAWSVAGGKIHVHGVNGDSILASGEQYSNVTFAATVSSANREASLAFRLQDENNGYLVVFAPAGRPSPGGPEPGYIGLIRRVAGNEKSLARYQPRKMPGIGQSAKIRVTAIGPELDVRLNGAEILRATDTTFTNGYLGFRVYGWEDYPCDSTFSAISFR